MDRRSWQVGISVGMLVAVLVALGLHANAQSGVRVFRCSTTPCIVHGNQLRPAATVIYGSKGDDRIWGGRGYDVIYDRHGRNRLHNFQAAAGAIYGGADSICVVGVKPGGEVNVTVHGCKKVIYRASQGHG